MDLSRVARVAIYPSIGIARVGNSPDQYFLGPTIPGQPASDPHDFRDSAGCIKRQAAKFFIYGLAEDGTVLGEINDSDGVEVTWRVEIANKKAAWYNFDLALDIPAAAGEYDLDGNATPGGLPLLSQRRNQDYQGSRRDLLMIKPSPQCIKGANTNQEGGGYQFDDGKINGKEVYLGELRTDEQGRLIFLGGRGHSASFDGKPLTTFANNQGWHDDTSDGTVDATVILPGNRKLEADGAWVITAPPNFAVGVQAFSTGYDLLQDVAAKLDASSDKPLTTSFHKDIYPILNHLTINQWVNAGVAREFGWGSAYDFDYDLLIQRAADPSPANRPFRQIIFESFRNPNYETMEALAWPPLYGDAVTFNVNSTDPRNWFAVTSLQYAHLENWAKGEFIPEEMPSKDGISPEAQAHGLTEAALEETLGGPFHPGCEFTWPMRHAIMYRSDSPFRIKRRENAKEDYGIAISQAIVLAAGGPLDGSSPGDITKWMAVPWQSDTSSCLSAYRAFSGEYLPTFWPARVPNDVLTQEDYNILQDRGAAEERKVKAFSPGSRKKWLRGYIYNDKGQVIGGSSISDRIKGVEKFTQEWPLIGIVVKKDLDAGEAFPQHVWVETGRQLLEEIILMGNGEPETYSDRPAWVEANPRTLR